MSAGEALRRFAGFWVDLIVGEDWRIAAGVVAIMAGGALVVATASVPVILPIVLLVAFLALFALTLLVGDDRA